MGMGFFDLVYILWRTQKEEVLHRSIHYILNIKYQDSLEVGFIPDDSSVDTLL